MSGTGTVPSVVDVFNRKSSAELKEIQDQAKQRVRRFVGDDDLWTEVNVRIINGQTVGQAFMNAGDHADRPYSWELDFDVVAAAHTWGYLALLLDRSYGTEANPKLLEGYAD